MNIYIKRAGFHVTTSDKAILETTDEPMTSRLEVHRDVTTPDQTDYSGALSDNKPMWRLLLVFLIPLVISNGLQSVGQLASSIILGQWIGVQALAAVSAFFPVFFLLVSFLIGMESGASILIGQAYGARNHERLKAIIGTTVTFTFLLGVALAVIGDVFTWDLLRIIGTPENILATSVSYARIFFTSLPVLFLYFGYSTFIRGTGDSTTPLYFLILSTVLNLALLPAMVFGWLFLPELGIYGSAYASVLSIVIALIAMHIYLYKTGHPVRFDSEVLHHLSIDVGLLKLLLRLGVPSSINMIIVSLSEIAVISFVNRFGSDATAAYGAVNQVASYVQMPAISLAIAVSIFAAQAIGANRMDRLRSVFRAGLALNYIVGGALIVLVYIFSRGILSLFLTDAHTLGIATSLLMITLWSYAIFGHAMIVSSVMRSSGTVLWPTIFSVASIWAVEVPVAYILSTYTKLGIEGIWIGYPAAFIVSLGLQYAYYKLVWQKQSITRLIS